jgi:sulfite exporter TauE/SafE
MELLMVFVGGLLGSSHCVGMCGGFVVSLGAGTPGWRTNLLRQVTYSLGRVFTYASAGAMAGYGGWRLTRSLPALVHVQSWLAVLAGVLLVTQGLLASGLWRRLLPRGQQSPCLTAGLFARFLSGRFQSPWGLANVVLAGTLNGLLPCGLVYAYLALATSTGNMLAGFVHMALFGLGTLPIMVLTGCGGGLLSLAGRRRLLHLAACCVIATGATSIWRGAAFLSSDAQIAAAKCPACSASE